MSSVPAQTPEPRPVPPTPPRPVARRRQLSLDEYADGVRAGDRAVLARAITLIESHSPQHIDLAQQLLTRLMPFTGGACRLGITGVPGVGKSTFIESFGLHLTSEGHRVAVLAIDPSSGISGGSILGDKTRMAQLAIDPNAFIRPSPSAGTLGGVASKTRETMLACEAAGFDVVLIETVGVGQSETVVADMTDCFLALMLPGAGDELQGIKRGLLEFADLIAVNKADGDNVPAAERAAAEYRSALHFMQPRLADWTPPVVTCSARRNTGLCEIWEQVTAYRQLLEQTGVLQARRREQTLRWMWTMVDEQLRANLKAHPEVKATLPRLEEEVRAGRLPPTLGARTLLRAFGVLKSDG
ncbi:MAG: methylmalonyl Co-A mutase-associated GTPase MeaB [Phycisphaerae bacterium]|jgi:LAO/AO transport system kinase